MTAVAPQVRGERLVAKVLEATMRELSNVGYRGLSIEVVAEQAGVNKTTIYRRWPTKAELVADAFKSTGDAIFGDSDEGSLRADLIAFAKRLRDMAASPQGKGIFRVLAAESEDPELAVVLKEMRETTLCIPEEMLERAVKRGEVPKGSDSELILSCAIAPILNWIQMDNLTVDDRRIEQVVNLVLNGALNGGAAPTSGRRPARLVPRPGPSDRTRHRSPR